MLRRKTRRTSTFDAGGDVLGKLLEREQQVTSRLDAARAEAERLVRDAREYARNTEASCESRIEERITRLSNSYEARAAVGAAAPPGGIRHRGPSLR